MGVKVKKMLLEIGIIGAIIGIFLGVLIDYYDKREYYKNFKRNLKEYRESHKK